MKKLAYLLVVLAMIITACNDGKHSVPEDTGDGETQNSSDTNNPNVPTGDSDSGSGGETPSGGASTLEEISPEAEASGAAFAGLMDGVVLSCTPTEGPVCECPGGGDIKVEKTGEMDDKITFDSCTTDDGMVYTGSITSDYGTEVINGMFSQFGECVNIQAIGIVMEECAGKMSGMCGGKYISCTFSEDDDEKCLCIPQVF